MSQPKKHILVIRLSAMGDVAMTVPVLRALLRLYPELNITVLTRAFFEPFFRDIKNLEVLHAEVNGKHKGIFGLYKLARELNKNRYYVIADLHNVLRTKILKKFLRSKRFITIDKGRKEKRALTSGKVFKPLKATHQRYVDVFDALGYPIDLSNPIFPERVVLNENLQDLIGEKTQKLIGIAPLAASEGKMYPLELMKIVIDKLSRNYKIILFGGGQKETLVLNELENTFENVISVAEKLGLNEEMDIISNLDLMVSMDSGNAHIAAMLGIRTITIWGVTHPYAGFTPFNQPEDYALLADRNQFPKNPTSIYGNKCPENYKEASRSIAPQTIIDKIKSILTTD